MLITSCSIPQTFFPFKNISLGNFNFIFFLLQNFLIICEIITGFIIENCEKDGYLFFKEKKIDPKKFPFLEIQFFP